MKILGIAAEYNPFHNGHIYHIEKSMSDTGADVCVVVMSGDFTQRGEAAVADKWTRSRWAVENGADLVLELPFLFACDTARDFAAGAVDILKGIGATHISFGAESGDADGLIRLAEGMIGEAARIDEIRRRVMEEGGSYAAAYEKAVGTVLGEERTDLMRTPNNILALEYLKRIIYWRDRGYVVEPHIVKRYGAGYNETNGDAGIAGASSIRRMISESDIAAYVPESVAADLREIEPADRWEERAFMLLRSELVKAGAERLRTIYRMGEGLENKFMKEIVKAADMRGFISSVVSKRYTEAAVRRLIIYVLTGTYRREGRRHLYGRVLAADAKGRSLLKNIKADDTEMPVITNINRETDVCGRVSETLRHDIVAADIYNIVKGRSMYEFSDRVMTPYISQKF